MFSSIKRIIQPLIFPVAVLILSSLIIWNWPFLIQTAKSVKKLQAIPAILPVLPYAVYCIGVILGWRFNNVGVILSLLTLGFSYYAMSSFNQHDPRLLSVHEIVGVLIPFNIAFFAIPAKRRMSKTISACSFILLLFQILAVYLLCSPLNCLSLSKIKKVSSLLAAELSELSLKVHSILRDGSFFGWGNISIPSLLAFSLAFTFLLIWFLRSKSIAPAGFLCALIAAFFGVSAYKSIPSGIVYFSASGLIMIITIIELSFSMAYDDELTGLPGRRSLNEALINLGGKFAIAMIDIDHFKKFNDTYGHDTGDQVLRMVASKLREISGGAKAYRYGGEEFTAIFPGKTVEGAITFLERYRRNIESTLFVVRSRARRKTNAKKRSTAILPGRKRVKVTVSIGVASPDKGMTKPHQVIMEADKALYRAKKAGRNQIKS